MNIEFELKNIQNEMETLKQKLDLILSILQEKDEKVNNLLKSSNKLDKHIEFVETTYESLFHPLNYIKNTINTISGNENKELIYLKK